MLCLTSSKLLLLQVEIQAPYENLFLLLLLLLLLNIVDECFMWASVDGLIIDLTLPLDFGANVAAPDVLLAVESMLKAFEWYWRWALCDSDEFDGVSSDEYILERDTRRKCLKGEITKTAKQTENEKNVILLKGNKSSTFSCKNMRTNLRFKPCFKHSKGCFLFTPCIFLG